MTIRHAALSALIGCILAFALNLTKLAKMVLTMPDMSGIWISSLSFVLREDSMIFFLGYIHRRSSSLS